MHAIYKICVSRNVAYHAYSMEHMTQEGCKRVLCIAVHELAASEIPKAYLFRGTKETTAQEVAKMLGLGLVQYKRHAGMPGPSGSPGLGRFLLPYSECDYTLESIIDDLQVLCLHGLHVLSIVVSCFFTEDWPNSSNSLHVSTYTHMHPLC